MTSAEVNKNLQNEKKWKRFLLVIVFALLTGLVGFYCGLQLTYQKTNPLVDKVIDIIDNEWYSTIYYPEDDVEAKVAQFISSISGLNYDKQLDPYTYLIKNEYGEARSYMGVSMQRNFDYPMIRYVYDHSPAKQAGLQPYDVILGVKKEDVWHYVDEESENYSTITSLCSGKNGETIELKIRRFHDKQFDDLYISVTFQDMIRNYATQIPFLDDTLFIRLDSFSSNSLQERSSVQMEEILKNNLDKQNLVLDLRDNGGGSVDSMVEICDLFLPKNQLIMTTEIKDKTKSKYYTKDNQAYTFAKIIILMNNNTASASEILISCLSYHLDNVILVGRKTFGKGIAQRKRVLNKEYSFQYTFAKWFTPGNIWIQEDNLKGIDVSQQECYIPYPEDYVMFYNLSNYYHLTHTKEFCFDMVDTNIAYLQQALNFLYPNLNLRSDGYFDTATTEAVKKFQYDYNLEKSGIVDESTFLIFTSLYSQSLENYYNQQHQQKVLEILGDIHG